MKKILGIGGMFVFLFVMLSTGVYAVNCGAIPTNGCVVVGNLTLTPGTYSIPNGIVINANNIILNCNGATLVGSKNGYAIMTNEGIGGLTIKNCVIKNYSSGISIGQSGNSVINNTFINMGLSDTEAGMGGIISGSGDNIIIRDNKFFDNYFYNAISVYSNNGNITIANNTISNGSTTSGIVVAGINSLSSLSSITITNNKVNNSNSIGISIDNLKDGLIVGNNLTNLMRGVEIQRSFYLNTQIVNVSYNNIINSNQWGIYYTDPYMADIAYNNFSGDSVGIYLSSMDGISKGFSSSDNKIYNNIFSATSGTGIKSDLFDPGITNPSVVPSNSLSYVYNNTFNDLRYGFVISKSSNLFDIYQNQFSNIGVSTIVLDSTQNNTVRENSIDNVLNGFVITNTSGSARFNKIYLNNLTNVVSWDIFSYYILPPHPSFPQEISYEKMGSYWGASVSPFWGTAPFSNSVYVGNFLDPFTVPVNKTSVDVRVPSWDWYFVSFHPSVDNTTVKSVLTSLNGNYSIVKYYVNGIGKDYTPGNPFNALTDMNPWYGYWIKVVTTPDVYTDVYGSTDLLVTGSKTTGCHPLSLGVGKQWVGYWSQYPKETGSALLSINGKYSYIRQYYNGTWRSYVPGLGSLNDLNELTPGYGYLIKMTSAGNLDYLC